MTKVSTAVHAEVTLRACHFKQCSLDGRHIQLKMLDKDEHCRLSTGKLPKSTSEQFSGE